MASVLLFRDAGKQHDLPRSSKKMSSKSRKSSIVIQQVVSSMAWLSFSDLQQQKTRYDARVRRTPEVDAFCLSSTWVLPAQSIYAPRSAAVYLAK